MSIVEDARDFDDENEQSNLLDGWPEKSRARFGNLLAAQSLTVLANVRDAIESDIQMIERFQTIQQQLERGDAIDTAAALSREGRRAVFRRFHLYEKLFTKLRKSMQEKE